MANPQREDGHIDIANEIAEALMRTNFSAYQTRILWAIWRKTYGWHKKGDWIPHSQLVSMTGIAKGNVSRALKELRMRNVVINSDNKIYFNKDYTQWRQLSKGIRGYQFGSKVIPNDNKKLSESRVSKETTKETYQKKYKETAQRIFEEYPKQRGGPQAIRNIVSLLNKGETEEKLLIAVENYKREIKDRDIPHDRTYYAYNFFGRAAHWRDYIDPDLDETDKALRDFERDREEIRAEKESLKGSPG